MPNPTACSLCDEPVHCRSLCKSHYNKWYRLERKARGKLTPDIVERFWRSVEKTESCWLWRGAVGKGYGQIWEKSRRLSAHRWSYEHFVGPIPDGLQIDHLCRVTICVNPAHLEPVTPRENVMRSTGLAARYARRTHCGKGHEYTPENILPLKRGRRCRKCLAEDSRARRRRGAA